MRVHAPTSIIFVCGGPYDVAAAKPISLRDAFLRVAHKDPFAGHTALIAEELNAFFPGGQYRDILSFESDIAQISELIVLFSESFGSAAELGAFAMVDEISRRMLVVIDDKNYTDASFISLGPIRMLENIYGQQSICVINRDDVGITNIRNVSNLDEASFERILASAFIQRDNTKKKEHTTFDPNRNGHIVKLIVGLIQHYGALTAEEIEVYLNLFEVRRSGMDLENLLLCAEFAKWIKKDRRGLNTYYAATADKVAFQYRLKKQGPILDRDRWKADIRSYWKAAEPDRFSSITQALGRVAR